MDLERNFLVTDLYQLNMMQAYLESGKTDEAVFEFFSRKLPSRRNFLMAAGLEQVLEFFDDFQVPADQLDWLKGSGRFSADFIDYLAGLRFAGDLHAIPEGTVVFPDEPILRLTAPLPLAQYAETRVLNILHLQTVIASKAARMTLAAEGRRLIDFGLRRAHGAEAGLYAARASYLAGFAGSATVVAGAAFGVPLYGTMAHSFIQSFDDETAAFEAFARARPDNVVLLIDTYDTEAGARKVVDLAPRLAADGIEIRGVRLDSGDLGALAASVRAILDDGGLKDVSIFASGGLDEDRIAELLRGGAPIDGFGIGTSLTTSSDAPALDSAYKLQEYAGTARRKWSSGKATWPGRKQIWRSRDADGRMIGDVLSTEDDDQPGEPLIQPIMRGGVRLGPPETMDAMRARAAAQLRHLPPSLRRLEPGAEYPVTVGDALQSLAERVDRRLQKQQEGNS